MQTWLETKIVEKSQIAMGLRFSFLAPAFTSLPLSLGMMERPFFVPSEAEIFLKIEELLSGAFQNEEKLKAYLKQRTENKKELAIHLTHLFHAYASYGAHHLQNWMQKPSSWQERLFQKVFAGWESPVQLVQEMQSPQRKMEALHVFGFSHLAKVHLEFFYKIAKNIPLYLYQFSPCAEFWSDLPTDREMKEDTFLEERHPLLANLGRLGRNMARSFEETYFLTEEAYEEKEEKTQLANLQNQLLTLQKNMDVFEDSSLQIHFVSSKKQEVELAFHLVQDLFQTKGILPQDIAILAPSIQAYEPWITSIFSDVSHQIHQGEKGELHALFSFFQNVHELEQNRWAPAALWRCILEPLFQTKKGWSAEDFSFIENWMHQSGIYWGFDAKERDQILLDRDCPRGLNDARGTWIDGIGRWLTQLSVETGREGIDFVEGEKLGDWIDTLYELQELSKEFKKSRSLEDWALFLEESSRFFLFETLPSSMRKLMEHLKRWHSFFPHRAYPYSYVAHLLEKTARNGPGKRERLFRCTLLRKFANTRSFSKKK